MSATSADPFEKVPRSLYADTMISLSARGVYPVLCHQVWLERGRLDEPVQLPPMSTLAALCGCSETALKGYLTELREGGWVETIRASRRRPLLYVVRSSLSDSHRLSAADSNPPVRRNPTNRARDPLQVSDKGQTTVTGQAVSAAKSPKRRGWKPNLSKQVHARLNAAVELCDDADEETLRVLVLRIGHLDPPLTLVEADYIYAELAEALDHGCVGNRAGFLYGIVTNVATGYSGPDTAPERRRLA